MSMRGVAAALLALSMAGNAQALYPDRPIRLIVAQSTGGNADIIGRALAEGLGERLGQTVVVDNRGSSRSDHRAIWVRRTWPANYSS